MPKNRNWSVIDEDEKQAHDINGEAWKHDHLDVVLSVFKEDYGYMIRLFDKFDITKNADVPLPTDIDDGIVEHKTKAVTIARRWMKHHPFPPYEEIYDMGTAEFLDGLDDWHYAVPKDKLYEGYQKAKEITKEGKVVHLGTYKTSEVNISPSMKSDPSRGTTGRTVSYKGVQYHLVKDALIAVYGKKVTSSPATGPMFRVEHREVIDPETLK